jgi:hypothetical protein
MYHKEYDTMKTHTSPAAAAGHTYCRRRRDKEFSQYYHEVLRFMKKHRVKNPARQALDYALATGSPHYDVDFDYAYRIMCAHLNRGSLPVKGDVRRALWLELAGKVQELMQAGVGVAPALEFVLEHGRASHFFISRSNVRAHLGKLLQPSRQYNLGSL